MTSLQQRENEKTDHREGNPRHRGGHPDLWGRERQRENDDRRQNGRHRMDGKADDDL